MGAVSVGGVCWLDLGVRDVEAATSFYGELLGWEVGEPDQAGYRLAGLPGGLVAAFGPAEDPGRPYWTVYAHTDDIHASTASVVTAGGVVVVPPTPAGDAGVAAVVRDPHGGPLSFWQPGTHLGTDTSGRPGTLAGARLRTPDPIGSHDFLRAVLGWELRSDGTIGHHGRTVATWTLATVGRREDDPSPWLVRFLVADEKAAVVRAVQLGAREAGEPGLLVDPTGALFGLTSRPTG